MNLIIAANKSCINKTNPQETAKGWKHYEPDIPWLMGWVKSGYGWCACHFVGRHRKGDNVAWKKGTNIVVVDVDGDTTLDEFWETRTAKSWCAATYTTSSHTQGEHRFRALFPLAKMLHSASEHRSAYWLIVNQLCPELDISGIKDNCGEKAERLWYGNTNTEVRLNSQAEVPDFLLNDISAEDEQSFNENSEATEDDIKRCQWLLENFLRPSEDGEYETYYTPVMAACSSVGARLADSWVCWVDRGHHGQKEANRSTSKWRGLGTHFAKLYKLAKEQDPDWKHKLPKELQWSFQGAQKGYAVNEPTPDYSKTPTLDHLNGDPSSVIPDCPPDIDVDKTKISNDMDKKVREERENVSHVRRLFINLRFNILTEQIEYDDNKGKSCVIEGRRFDVMTTELAIEHAIHIRKEPLISAVTYVALQNSYCPIERYLQHCERNSTPHESWDNVGVEFLGNDHPLAKMALQRLMIGAVARAFNPGCSMSWLPILIGKQGAGKSQFARQLAPDHLFAEISTPLEKLSNEPARLHNSWIIELPEIDYQFKTKNIEPFKNLITTRVDETRKPYARDPEKLYRKFVFIGTTNQSSLLVDSTGNRRFVPLEIGSGHIVPWQRLQNERDALWAAAIRDYRNGKPYEFTSGEIEKIAIYIKQFADPDPWEEMIYESLRNKDEVEVNEILLNTLGYQNMTDKMSRRETKRIIDVLQSLGWRKLRTNRKNKVTNKMESKRLWLRPENDPIDDSHINYDF